MSFMDWAHRKAYRYGFRAARLLWRVTGPRHMGALVMVWHDKKVLLVRPSYQDGWAAPGGGVKGGEAAIDAALREASEELGLQIAPEQLHHALAVEHLWNNRHDKVEIFETEVPHPPQVRIDNREIIEAKFFTIGEAQLLSLPPHLKDYFRMRTAVISPSGPNNL